MFTTKTLNILLLLFFPLFIFASGKKDNTDFPDHPLTIIVPFAVNGGTDEVARLVKQPMEKILGQNIIIKNKIGSSGAVGMVSGAAAIPDGYTLTMISREIISLPALGLAEITKDDFMLLGLINKDPAVLIVPAYSRFTTLEQLIEEAESDNVKIKFASAAKPHFYILELERSQNILFNKIPYNGAARAIPAMVRGQADFTIANPGELKEFLDTGEIRALAIMSDQRIPLMPDTPTFKELGYDLTSFTWRGLAIPLGTPDEIRETLESAVKEACSDPSFIRTMNDTGYYLEYLESDDFSEFIEKDSKTITSILEN